VKTVRDKFVRHSLA